MAYTLSFGIALGAANASLTLEAQLVDTGGANVGSTITTGFVNIGVGNYLWTGTAIPDGHRGGVKFQVSPGGALKAFAAVNPQEAENLDAKVTTRAALSAVLGELSAGVPPSTPTVEQALMLLYMALRNKMETASNEIRFFNDGGSVIAKSSLSDTGALFTRNELTGP